RGPAGGARARERGRARCTGRRLPAGGRASPPRARGRRGGRAARGRRWARPRAGGGTMSRREEGQALLLLIAALAAVLIGAFVLGAVARGVGAEGRDQRAADLAALAGARAMRAAYDRLFEPPTIAGRPNPRHLERGAYLALGRDAATRTARANDAHAVEVGFPDATAFAPVRIA